MCCKDIQPRQAHEKSHLTLLKETAFILYVENYGKRQISTIIREHVQENYTDKLATKLLAINYKLILYSYN